MSQVFNTLPYRNTPTHTSLALFLPLPCLALPCLPQREGTVHTLDLLPKLLARVVTPSILTHTGGEGLDEIIDGQSGIFFAEHTVKSPTRYKPNKHNNGDHPGPR